MKKILILCLIGFALQFTYAGTKKYINKSPQLNPGRATHDIHQIAILDIMSSSFTKGKRRILTDVLRTELFKLHLFKLIERGVIETLLKEHHLNQTGMIEDSDLLKVGKFLSVDRIFVTIIESFDEIISINVRVIDVNTSMVEYTENVFIDNQKNIFAALEELVKKVELFYVVEKDETDPALAGQRARKQWNILGASSEESDYLIGLKTKVGDFLDLRQYDITFSIKEYIFILKNGWEGKVVKSFLQSGISYKYIKKALKLGIISLDNYAGSFKLKGYSFKEYLDAYENNIVTVKEYAKYKKGYRRNRANIQLGFVADNIPVTLSRFSKIMGELGWEYFFTRYQRNVVKASATMGMFFMQPFLPIPHFETTIYLGKYPYYFKIGGGVLIELLVGGHVGGYAAFGMEFMEHLTWTVLIAAGNQPRINYKDFKRITDPDYVEIDFPYFAVLFGYKI